MYSVGIDVGGTFTDLVLINEEDNTIQETKVPTTPENQLYGIANALEKIASLNDMNAKELIPKITNFVHGTTVVTNTMLEYKGAKTALLTTEGFRDSIEMRLAKVPNMWDFFEPRPPHIVPRYLRFGVRERVLWDGSVHIPLDEDQLEEIIAKLKKENVEAVAVCFLFSYENPAHEKKTKEILEKGLPNVFVSISSEVSPKIREFQRTNTTLINSYVGRTLSNYLFGLENYLKENGKEGEFYLIQQNGGITVAKGAEKFAVRSILSGPAGGAVGGVNLGKSLGEKNLIIADMGGTSFDVSLVKENKIEITTEGEVGGQSLNIPMLNIYTIGAGGGSIARLEGKMLMVGPQSAGANPGPACYDSGGDAPTVTDANLVLGYINPDYFLGGERPLNKALSERVIQEKIARPLNISLEEAAYTIHEIINQKMVDAIHKITVQKGHDPRDFAFVAIGGACPVHSQKLAAELSIRKVIIPRTSSVFSAEGMLMADIRYDFVRTYITVLDELNLGDFNETINNLKTEGVKLLKGLKVKESLIALEGSIEMRYYGQHHEITLPFVAENFDHARIGKLAGNFHQMHETFFGYSEPQKRIEIMNLGIAAIGKMPKPEIKSEPLGPENARDSIKGRRSIYMGLKEGYSEVDIYAGEKLKPGNRIKGPAVIEEVNTTVLLGPNQSLFVDGWKNYIVSFD